MSFQITEEEGELLVKLARKAVEEFLKTKGHVPVPKDIPEKLLQRCGVFVTLNSFKRGGKELRGCIGYPYPTDPLVHSVIESAICSATQDPRFCPLSLDELDKTVFEISVLTPPQAIEVKKPTEYPSKIKIGEDGLIVERGMFKGLLLPQVPVEWNWDQEEFLCQACCKAGLSPDCWLMKNTVIYKFQAIIFEEEEPAGKVKRRVLGGT
ncbi:MAG TPA: TIGR00296 family protein [Candidatus Acidoferrum sp.]|nr:TIGR00296 family protein [Candidatus Acidoferrum sp.]